MKYFIITKAMNWNPISKQKKDVIYYYLYLINMNTTLLYINQISNIYHEFMEQKYKENYIYFK